MGGETWGCLHVMVQSEIETVMSKARGSMGRRQR